MVRVAGERIADLFALAQREATSSGSELPDRYVRLARRIGTRYNVRLLPEYRELYCRSCSAFWVEGRTVRTRLRGGRRVRTCLRCGHERRSLLRSGRTGSGVAGEPPGGVERPEGALVEGSTPSPEDDEEEENSEEG